MIRVICWLSLLAVPALRQHINASTGLPGSDFLLASIVDGAKMRTASGCAMQTKFLVTVPSVSDAPPRRYPSVRGARNLHCTARVKDVLNNMLGGKLRTGGARGPNPAWREGMLVPVACPGRPADAAVEFSIRDPPAFPRPYTETLGSAKVYIDAFVEGAQTLPLRGRVERGRPMSLTLQSRWCPHAECLERFRGSLGLEGPLIEHPGLDCGAGCHSALMALTKHVVSRARDHLGRAEFLDGSDGAGEASSGYAGLSEADQSDAEARTHHDRLGAFWEEAESGGGRSRAAPWESMRELLPMVPLVARKACGDGMPLLPSARMWVDGKKVQAEYNPRQAGQIRHYLSYVEGILGGASAELRRLWMGGEAYALKAGDSGCPTSHSSWEWVRIAGGPQNRDA